MASWYEERAAERRRKEIREEHRAQHRQAIKEGRVKPDYGLAGWGALLAWVIVFAVILFIIGALNAGTNTMPVTETMQSPMPTADATAT